MDTSGSKILPVYQDPLSATEINREYLEIISHFRYEEMQSVTLNSSTMVVFKVFFTVLF